MTPPLPLARVFSLSLCCCLVASAWAQTSHEVNETKAYTVKELTGTAATGGNRITVSESASHDERIVGLVSAPAPGTSYGTNQGDLTIDVRSHSNAIAIHTQLKETISFSGPIEVKVQGQKALENLGTIALQGKAQALFDGDVVSSGQIFIAESQAVFSGASQIKSLVLAGNSLLSLDHTAANGDTIRAGTMVVEKLTQQGSQTKPVIALNGYQSSDPTAMDSGARLVVHEFQTGANGTITVADNAVLGLGNIDPKNMAHQIAMSQVLGYQERKPTLITAGTNFNLHDVSIVFGNGPTTLAADGGAGSIVFSEPSRWIIDLAVEAKSNAENSNTLSVVGKENTDLVLWGWDGSDLALDLDFDGWKTHLLAGTDFRGSLTAGEDGKLHLERFWLHQLPNYAGSAMTKVVEELSKEELEKEYRPGWRWMADGLSPDRITDNLYVNVMESGIFLPLASGVLQALERADDYRETEILAHRPQVEPGKTKVWAAVWDERRRAHELFSGANGRYGFQADSVGGSLGFDRGLNPNWSVGAAVSAATTDVKSRGVGPNVWGDGTMATLTGFARYREDGNDWTAAISFAQIDATSKLLANGHRLQADNKAWLASAAVRWGFAVPVSWVQPSLMAGLYGARLKEGEITDSFGAISGKGFSTESDDRWWGRVGGDVRVTHDWELFGVSVAPWLALGARVQVGDLDWQGKSTLVDGPSAARAYAAGSRWQGTAAVGLELAKAGMTEESPGLFAFFSREKPAPKMVEYGWKLQLQAGIHKAPHGEDGKWVGASYVSLW